jgi:Holliday junction resolvasome RuvABC endonuclease subunit
VSRLRVLAIDGALNHSGWVILDDSGGEKGTGIKASKYGVIKANTNMTLGFKLASIKKEVAGIINMYKPDIVVIEDTYSGKNALTNARLNNAKGAFILTVFELLGKDPVYVGAAEARYCLGFKNNKEEPYAYFKKLFNLKESFEKGNDITDAYVLGYWYITEERGECKARKKKSVKKKVKSVKPTRKNNGRELRSTRDKTSSKKEK